MKLYLYSILIPLMLVACTRKQVSLQESHPALQPSSEIPARREFPVSSVPGLACKNFYQYACDKVIQSFKLREDRNRHIFSINDSVERILEAKKTFLGKLVEQDGLSERTQQLKDSFAACMNVSARQKEEKEAVKQAVEKMADLTDRGALLRFFGDQISTPEAGFLAFYNDANLANPSKFDLILLPQVKRLPSKELYRNPKVVADYQKLLKVFFETIGSEDPSGEAERVVALEKAFAETYLSPQEIRTLLADASLYVSREQLLADYPNLALEDLLKKVPPAIQARSVFSKSMAFLNEMLENESVPTLKALYLLHSLSDMMEEAYPAYWEKKREFATKHLGSPPTLPERKERCTAEVMAQFDKELDAELLPVLFPDFPKERFMALADRVREAIVRRLEKNTWLTDKGREGALNKMRKARMQLASPNDDVEWDFVSTTKLEPDAPLANQKRRSAKVIEKMFEKFSKGRDWRVWSMGPLTVNAYYSPEDNKFVMLQGILQYPFFDEKMSDAANLGAVGMVIGHELGHGFDNTGSRFDEDGILRAWMPKEDLQKFTERTDRLVTQFNKLVSKDINSEYGSLTLGENIADVSGLAFAYEAAFPGNEGSVEDKKAFYLQYARLWCGVMREKELEQRLRTDYHAQTENRVNEPLKHQPGFYEAYSCKEGDGMFLAPADRLELW